MHTCGCFTLKNAVVTGQVAASFLLLVGAAMSVLTATQNRSVGYRPEGLAESGTTQLYFVSAPFLGGTQAVADIYVSTLGPDGFGTPSPVTELNTSKFQEGGPRLRHDGREIYFQSNRDGWLHIWASSRASTAESWSPPVPVPIDTTAMSGVAAITTPVLSWDARTLFIGVVQPTTDLGNVFVCSREKLRGKP